MSRDLRAIYGTWDFKWPVGHNIKIAYQGLRDDSKNRVLGQAIAAFRETIASWESPKDPANISWESVEHVLPAPGYGEAKSVLGHSQAYVDYDILVSFAPLPIRIARTENRPYETMVATQTSELGSYANRVDYGVPTLFLGPAGEFANRGTSEWIRGADFRAAAVHEFGHALGVPHAHQNPNYPERKKLRTANEIRKILEDQPRFRAFPAVEIEPEIRAAWPSVVIEGEVQFSDWLIRGFPRGPLEASTCMAHPGWSRFLKTPPSNANAVAPKIIKELERATDLDRALLRAMYRPSRPQR